MINLANRIAALENFSGKAESGIVIAFMIDGASDEDVIAVRNMNGSCVERASGETLAELVERVKAGQPPAPSYGFFFTYSDAVRVRLGKEYMPEALPNAWPIPSPSGHACHAEHWL